MPLVLACVLAAGAALGGCAGRGGDIPYATQELPAPDPGTRNLMPGNLPLGPLDQVRITVFRVPDLSGEYIVGADGTISMPLIGRVDLRNRTPDEAAALIEQQYGARYLNDPHVSIQVAQSNQRNITVEGGVGNPGNYPIAGSTTLVGAIAAANGISPESGNPRRVAIIRRIEGQQMAAAFDLVDIRRGKMANPTVYPGDIVVVEGNGLRSIYREVLSTLPVLAIFNPF